MAHGRTTPARTGTGPVTGVLRSSVNEWGRRDHSKRCGRHGAPLSLDATQMQHDSRYAMHITILLGILIPPFPGSNPGAPASKSFVFPRLTVAAKLRANTWHLLRAAPLLFLTGTADLLIRMSTGV